MKRSITRLAPRTMAIAVVLAAASAFAGCGSGDVAKTNLPAPPAPKPGLDTTGTGNPDDCIAPACQDVPFLATTHVGRLTNPQWERTMRDLLKLDALPGNSVGFPADPATAAEKFGNEAGDLIVTTTHWAAYQKAAETLATFVSEDPSALDRILPADAKAGDTTARMQAFVKGFLPRAYRRDVTPAEIAGIVTAAEQASALATAGDPFAVRVKWALTTILQSPHLLYRVALGEADAVNGRARLGAFEIATKLSYGLWGTMPDEALEDAARTGKLSTKEGVAQVARDMLQDPRAAAALLDFHDLLYLVDHYPEVKNRPVDLFPKFYPTMMKDTQEDVRRTVRELVIDNNGGWKELLTSSIAYVNRDLAGVYGVDANSIPELANASSSDVWVKVDLDPSQRKGLLTHAGWLTYQGSPKDPAPIHRGAYVARHVVCQQLGSPPPGAAGAKIDANPAKTNRERVTATTAKCGDGCHGGRAGVINPLGFAFEGFDSIGQLRTKDGEFPLDTTGEVEVIGKFDDAVTLFDKAATNARSHACYAAHWASYLNGTSFVDVTPRWLSPAVAKSLKNGSVRDIIVEIVQTDAFLTVSR